MHFLLAFAPRLCDKSRAGKTGATNTGLALTNITYTRGDNGYYQS